VENTTSGGTISIAAYTDIAQYKFTLTVVDPNGNYIVNSSAVQSFTLNASTMLEIVASTDNLDYRYNYPEFGVSTVAYTNNVNSTGGT
jgi:hypothetical protein